MYEERVAGDTYIGFIHVFEADEEGACCDRCRTKLFRGNILIAFDGSGEGSAFDDITICEPCLRDLASIAQDRATTATLNNDSSCMVEWTETLFPRWLNTNHERTIQMRFDWDSGLTCDRCNKMDVAVPIFSFDGTGGLYDSLDICHGCVYDLLNIGRNTMLNVTMDQLMLH